MPDHQTRPDATSTMRSMLRALPSLTAQPPAFDPTAAPDDPAALFADWLSAAIEHPVPEPHAMTLSTFDGDGGPDARVLVLKDLDEEGWWFATSSESPKGRQLSARPHAALTFYWPALGRQVRVRGPVVRGSQERSATDFRARGAGARAVALASRVSEPLAEEAFLDDAVREARSTLTDVPDLVAPTWQTYAVVAQQVEFWQADPDRRHTRLQYERTDTDRWARRRLWP
jgi:pyridoxamine 5'-phosphate oxidase